MPEVKDENPPRFRTPIPDLVIERVVKDEHPPFLPCSDLATDADGASRRHLQSEMAADPCVAHSAVWLYVGSAGKAGEIHHAAFAAPR